MKNIENRISRLEKSVRFYQRLSLASILLVGCLVLVSATTQRQGIHDILKTKRLELVSDTGELLIRMTQSGQGENASGAIQVLNQNQKEVLFFGTSVETNGGYLELYDQNGTKVFNVSNNQNVGGGNVWLYDAQGNKKLYLGTDSRTEDGKVCTYNKTNELTDCIGTARK